MRISLCPRQVGRVENAVNPLDAKRRPSGAELQDVLFVGDKGMFAQPEHTDPHACADVGPHLAGHRCDLATFDIDLIGEGKARCLVG
jgi:hypothetical protein